MVGLWLWLTCCNVGYQYMPDLDPPIVHRKFIRDSSVMVQPQPAPMIATGRTALTRVPPPHELVYVIVIRQGCYRLCTYSPVIVNAAVYDAARRDTEFKPPVPASPSWPFTD